MKKMLTAVFGFFMAAQALATESNLVMECTGSHSSNTLVRVYEVIGSQGLAQLNIFVRSSSGNDDEQGRVTTTVYGAETITKNDIPLKRSAFGWAIRKSAEAIMKGEFYGFLFVTAPAYSLENPTKRGPETLYLNLQRYEGVAPNLMVLNGQVDELDCLPSKN